MKKNKLILVILLLLFSAAIAYESIIYVSPIKGRVVDAETGKPMKGANVRAGWVTGYADPGGGSFRTFKVYATKTDENGEFVLPKVIKFKVPVIEHYQGVNMLIYDHGYVCQYIERREWREGGKIKYYQISLKTIREEEFNENIHKIEVLDFFKEPDYKFIIDEYKMFLEKYPHSRFFEENYRALAITYKKTKDYRSALRVNEEFIKKFPNSSILGIVKEDIQTLKKLVQESPKAGGDNER